jgi:hypothetical protein
VWLAEIRLGENRLAEARALFERALEDKGITAWVGCNDKAALSALRYLEGKGRKAPAHLSVAGFDNSRESFEGGLTSFHCIPEKNPTARQAATKADTDTQLLSNTLKGFFRGRMMEITFFVKSRGTDGQT